jgi:uncharacterized protein (TIGR02996 family)
MSTTELSLLRSVIADPQSDSLRLVYADYLEERGDPRADFIRLQCELAALPTCDARRYSLEPRVQALLTQYRTAWERPFLELGACECEFTRGFVESVTISAAAFLQHNSALFGLAPVRRVHLVEATDHLFSLSHCAALTFLSCLDLTGNDIPDSGAHALAASPCLTPLSSLMLCSTRLSDTGIRVILASNTLSSLEALDLSGCPLEDWELSTLFDQSHLHSLRTLTVNESFPDLTFFFRSPGFPLLTSLDLSRNNLTDLAPLCNCPRLMNLHTLLLHYNWIEDPELPGIAHSEPLRRLRHLDLANNWIGASGLHHLLLSPHADKFLTIRLSFNQLGDTAAAFLATGPVLSSLRLLELEHTHLTSSGAHALATCPTLPSLNLLNLRSNNIDDTAAAALRQRFGDGVLL